MKKLLSIILLVFMLLNTSLSFAGDFQVETKLSTIKQESYKKQIDSIYKGLEKQISKLSGDTQIININIIISKIDILLKTKLSDKNNFVLSYLNYLLKDKLDFLQNEDNISLSNILKVDNKKIIENKTTNTEIKAITCSNGYSNQNGTCIKNQETPINVNVNNQVATRNCYIDNGQGQETYSNNSGGACNVVSCNNSYHKEGNSCLSNNQSCNIDNGNGYKTWNLARSNCNINSCNSGFENQNGKCIKYCNSNQHIDGNNCVENTIDCSVENGYGIKAWNGSIYGICTIKNCDDSSYLQNGSCIRGNEKDIILKNVNISYIFNPSKSLSVSALKFNVTSSNKITLKNATFKNILFGYTEATTLTVYKDYISPSNIVGFSERTLSNNNSDVIINFTTNNIIEEGYTNTYIVIINAFVDGNNQNPNWEVSMKNMGIDTDNDGNIDIQTNTYISPFTNRQIGNFPITGYR